MFAILRISGLPFKIDRESLSRAAVERFAAAVRGKHSILPKGRIDVVNRLKPIVPAESRVLRLLGVNHARSNTKYGSRHLLQLLQRPAVT
jgi:hypothetical protein